ncbi:hypothetical protein [Erythrobacter sp.]|uniref:hypothetical protein n=1 Tax=Erythrobacter sp. TaxID=1042 RepID=UPI00311FCEA8
MKDDPQALILEAVERIPDWLRRDLASRDEATRQRANETLAGMIASVLVEHAKG